MGAFPGGKDAWFGVARVGVGMTALTEAEAVVFSEPQDMPTPIEMEPATGKALQEFVRYQSVAYGTPGADLAAGGAGISTRRKP